MLAPHVTLVFPLHDVVEAKLLAHVQEITAGQPRVPFVMRCSLLVKDDSSDTYYAMLVPDEGFSGIVRLHDKLYTGMLTRKLRLDLSFTPHITIGGSLDVFGCKSVVDELNGEDFAIGGELAYLEVVRKEGEKAWTVGRFALT